ncbi:MAG: tyrosine-type recombinase/integrase [bacterium]|nr:tyrosine-type recombinase/integrase [bacterium]
MKLSLFTGMRMNEILQLTPKDIRQSKDGIWFIDVNTDNGKRIKTLASKRQVPIPDYLIKQGFLVFVDTCMTSTLFDIPPSKKTNYRSDTYSKRYAYFCKKKQLLEDKCSFHSLRHNFKDYAEEADVPESVFKQMAGWTEGSVSGNYGNGHKMAKLKGYIDRIADVIVADLKLPV